MRQPQEHYHFELHHLGLVTEIGKRITPFWIDDYITDGQLLKLESSYIDKFSNFTSNYCQGKIRRRVNV